MEVEMEEVRELDTDLDNGDRVTLTITLGGSLSVQTFKETSSGAKPFYRLTGSTILPAEVVREWATTLFQRTRQDRQAVVPEKHTV